MPNLNPPADAGKKKLNPSFADLESVLEELWNLNEGAFSDPRAPKI